MRTVTIYLRHCEEFYQGKTARGKTLSRAILNAHNKTSNAWHLPTYIKLENGKYQQYNIREDSFGKPMVTILKERIK